MNARVILAIAIAVISVWAGSVSTFAILFGQQLANIIVAISALTVASLGAALGVLSTQTCQVTSVRGMDGVENILVNAKASPALAAMAVDPDVHNIEAMVGAKPALMEIAKAA
jgi:maltodextrin utilization protein YvdJ